MSTRTSRKSAARRPTGHSPNGQRGMGLIEILVGVLIGMIGIVVIFQVLQISEERKRTTGAGSDAQITGTIGMYGLSRDLALAGYGFGVAASAYMGCNVSAYDSARSTPNFAFNLAPVVITNGAGGAPDTIAVLYGNSSEFVVSQTYDTATGISKHTQGRNGFERGDLVVAVATAPVLCALVEITGNTNADAVTIDHVAGSYPNFYTATNVNSRYNSAAGSPVNSGSGFLFNLGPSPRLNVWQIQNNTLTVTDNLHNTTTPTVIADGVINLQAQYGIDGSDGSGLNNMISDAEWTNAAPADWTRLLAIRVAVLARSQQYEPQRGGTLPVTPAAPVWAGGAFTMTNVDGTADTTPGDANDWRNYRYRVYQVVIPLRNMIWGTT